MKKLLLLLILAFALCLGSCGCDDDGEDIEPPPQNGEEPPTPEPQPFPLIVGGVEISASPESVVSLSPSLTEIIHELGFSGRIVGRGSYCDFPEVITSKPDAGSSANPDIDKIIQLAPELLLTSTPLSSIDVFRMEQAGITTLVIPSSSDLDDLRDVYRALGLIFNGLFTGAEAGEEAYSIISRACDNTGVVNIGKFIYLTKNLTAATGDTLEHSILSCFGDNLAKGGKYYQFDLSLLLENQPDVILLSDNYTAEDLRDCEYLSELNAVKEGRIIFIDNTLFERPSARIADLISKMITDYRNI